MHVHGGFLAKIAEEVGFQADCHSDDVLFWLTDLGWIMGPWQIIGTLAWGATMFCFDGAPDFPGPDRLWAMVERHRITILGVSPTLVRALMAKGDEHVTAHDLSSLRVLASTGEPWNEGPWRWYFERIGGGRCSVINVSGGTEVGLLPRAARGRGDLSVLARRSRARLRRGRGGRRLPARTRRGR